MTATTTLSGKGSGSVCSGQESAGTECYTFDLSAGLRHRLQLELSESLSSSFTLKGDLLLVTQNSLPSDESFVTPIQVTQTPPGQDITPRWSLQFKIFQINKKVAIGDGSVSVGVGSEASAKPGSTQVSDPAETGIQREIVYRMERAAERPGTFKTYLEAGGTSVVPESRGEYQPQIDNPFASVPGQDVPATFAVRGGLLEVPMGPFSLGAEGGWGFGGPVTGSRGYSLLGTARLRLGRTTVGAAYERTVQNAPAEPELNQYYEGDGDSEVHPGIYGFLEIRDFITLYGGHVLRRVTHLDFSGRDDGNPDGKVELERRVSYGALRVPFPRGVNLGLMHAVQRYDRDYVDGARGVVLDATGHLTTAQVDKAIGAGFAVSAILFFQQTEGSGVEPFTNSGGFFKLAWNGNWDHPW